MAHLNGKIFIDPGNPNVGVSISDIQQTIHSGKRDIGSLITTGAINKYSLHKPVRSSLWGGTEQQVKVPAMYGWEIDKKTSLTSGSTATFIGQLKSQGASYEHWRYLRPRGVNGTYAEPFRFLDFDGYNHNQLPYRTPVYFNRLTATPIEDSNGNNLDESPIEVTIPRQQTITEVVETATFRLTDAYDVSVVVSITDPDPDNYIDNTSMHWYVDGDFQVQLVDATGKIVDSDYSTGFGIMTHNIPQKLSFHFENFHSLEGYTQPFFIRYRLHMENQTYFVNPNDENEYVPVKILINTTYANTLAMSYTGKDGVVVRPSGLSSEWIANGYRAREAVFGVNCAWPIVCIEVTNGSTTQRKLALIPGTGFIAFKRVGITIQPGTRATDIIVYMLYGNYQQIFPQVSNEGIDYGDLSLADSCVLTTAPNCYNELGNIPQPPPPMIVHQDDFYSGQMTWTDNTTSALHSPNQTGVITSDKGIKVFSLEWAFYIENVTVELPVTITMRVFNGDDDLIETDAHEYLATVGNWQIRPTFVANQGIVGYNVDEVYIKIDINVNGDMYYLNILNQTISQTEQGPFYIGTNPS